MSDPMENESPSAVLRAEHQIILRVINVLLVLVERSERGEGFEQESLQRCVEFIRLFADTCHHAKEEDLLFPMLESRGIPRDGGPIGVMLEEHRMGRAFTQQMGEALEAHAGGAADAAKRFHTAARQYGELLTGHIYKEDNILYPMGDGMMSPEDQRTLCEGFCVVACKRFAGKSREELERIADELEAQWPAP